MPGSSPPPPAPDTASAAGPVQPIGAHDSGVAGEEDAPRHVLLVILDDIGHDAAEMYGAEGDGRAYAPMPTVSAICEDGVQFWRAWSSPTCSPTRAGLMTGRYGFRYNIGSPIVADGALPLSEVTLPEVLASQVPDIALANIGKWHLGTIDDIGGDDAPNRHGWPYYAGHLHGTLEDFFEWTRVEDGTENMVTDYATSRTVDDAILWLGEQDSEAPWMLWLAFNAPHDPFHVPPEDLHGYTGLTSDVDVIAKSPHDHYRASLESLDTELARLLEWIERHGHGPVDIIVMGDNGTPRQIAEETIGTTNAKGTVFEAGVNVPLCVSGPSVVDGGRDSRALVQTLDLYATIADLFEVNLDLFKPAPHRDAVSFLPILDGTVTETRQWLFTERFVQSIPTNSSARAVRTDQYKLMRVDTENDGTYDTESLYDLSRDPYEQDDLLLDTLTPREQAAYEMLSDTLEGIE